MKMSMMSKMKKAVRKYRARISRLILLSLLPSGVISAAILIVVYQSLPFVSTEVIVRTTGLLLTVEGLLLGMSPLVKHKTLRLPAIGVILFSILLSSLSLYYYDVYQGLRLVPYYENSFFLADVILFVAAVDIYALAVSLTS